MTSCRLCAWYVVLSMFCVFPSSELALLKSAHSEALHTASSEHAARIEAQSSMHADALRAALDGAAAAHKSALDAAVRGLAAEHAAAIEALRACETTDGANAVRRALTAAHAALVGEIESRHKRELAAAESSSADEVSIMMEAHAGLIADQKAEADAALLRARDELDALRAAHAAEQERRVREQQGALDEVRASHAAAMHRVIAEHDEALRRAAAELAAADSAARLAATQAASAHAAALAECEWRIQSAAHQRDAEIKKLEAAAAQLKAVADDERARASDAHAALQRRLDESDRAGATVLERALKSETECAEIALQIIAVRADLERERASVVELQSHLSTQIDETNASASLREKQHLDSIAACRHECDAMLLRVRAEHEAVVNALRDSETRAGVEYQRKLDLMASDHASQCDHTARSDAQAVALLESTHAAACKMLADEFAASQLRQSQAHERSLADVHSQHAVALSAASAAALQKLEVAIENERLRLTSEFEAEMLAERGRAAASLNAMRERLLAEHSAEMGAAESKTIAQCRHEAGEELSARLAEERAVHAERMAATKLEHDNTLDSLRQQHSLDIARQVSLGDEKVLQDVAAAVRNFETEKKAADAQKSIEIERALQAVHDDAANQSKRLNTEHAKQVWSSW